MSRLWPRLLVALAILLAVVVGAAWFVLFRDDPRYAAVASIERRADYRDAALMRRAWALPVAARYAAIPYEFQDNSSYCGPTSVADVLHSLGVRTDQHRVIAGTPFEPAFGILLGGLTIDQLADLLRQRTGRRVAVDRPASLTAFRAVVAGANDGRLREIVNFHRGPLFGRGHGHFSPILGYLAERDLVFVGDVNARFQPFLVPTARLWRAAATVDPATGRPRGILVAAP